MGSRGRRQLLSLRDSAVAPQSSRDPRREISDRIDHSASTRRGRAEPRSHSGPTSCSNEPHIPHEHDRPGRLGGRALSDLMDDASRVRRGAFQESPVQERLGSAQGTETIDRGAAGADRSAEGRDREPEDADRGPGRRGRQSGGEDPRAGGEAQGARRATDQLEVQTRQCRAGPWPTPLPTASSRRD